MKNFHKRKPCKGGFKVLFKWDNTCFYNYLIHSYVVLDSNEMTYTIMVFGHPVQISRKLVFLLTKIETNGSLVKWSTYETA